MDAGSKAMQHGETYIYYVIKRLANMLILIFFI